MRIGKTLASGRADGEARYYEPDSATGRAVVGEQLGVLVPLNLTRLVPRGDGSAARWLDRFGD